MEQKKALGYFGVKESPSVMSGYVWGSKPK